MTNDNQPVMMTTLTDDITGAYQFTGLADGNYTVTVTPAPNTVVVGDSVGTVNGLPDGNAIDPAIITDIGLVGGNNGINYNFVLSTCCQG